MGVWRSGGSDGWCAGVILGEVDGGSPAILRHWGGGIVMAQCWEGFRSNGEKGYPGTEVMGVLVQ